MNTLALRNTHKQRETLPTARLAPVSFSDDHSHHSPRRQACKAARKLSIILIRPCDFILACSGFMNDVRLAPPPQASRKKRSRGRGGARKQSWFAALRMTRGSASRHPLCNLGCIVHDTALRLA